MLLMNYSFAMGDGIHSAMVALSTTGSMSTTTRMSAEFLIINETPVLKQARMKRLFDQTVTAFVSAVEKKDVFGTSFYIFVDAGTYS